MRVHEAPGIVTSHPLGISTLEVPTLAATMVRSSIQIPRVLVELTLRLVFLRLVLIATPAALYFIVREPDYGYSAIFLACLTLVHNFTR
jgi:hypothetical protein